MLAKEMHVQFELGLQKLGALSRRKFYDQEIDSFLNQAQDQFIKDSIRIEEDDHGFQKAQIDVDKLRGLIIDHLEIPAEYKSNTINYREYWATLPDNYAHLMGYSFYQAKNCSTTVTSVSKPRYAWVLPIPNSGASSDYYEDVKLEIGVTTIVDLVEDTAQGGDTPYSGYLDVEQKFSMINLLREIVSEKLNNGTIPTSVEFTFIGVFFERYQSLYYPGQLIVIVEGTGSEEELPVLTIDGDTYSPGSEEFLTVGYIQDSTTTYRRNSGRLVRTSNIDDMLETVYYKPLKDSPLLTVDKGRIKIYSHPSWIVNKTAISYVKKPQKIDVTLQRNCELADEFHQLLVDKAIELAAGRLEQRPLVDIVASENKTK